MSNVLLKVNNLDKQLSDDFCVKNIGFEQEALQKIAIIGESGSGKTTLLKMIAGLMQSTAGNIFLGDERILGPEEQLIAGHKKIGYLSQEHELHNNYIVKDLLWFDNKLPIEEAENLFNICHIAHLLNRKTNQLSGGEKQRIALCKLLIKKPVLLVLDEPYSNLDNIHKQTLKRVLELISASLNITILLSSHEPTDVLSWADEIIVIRNGEMIQKGKTASVYNKPQSEYVAALLGNYNLLNHKQLELLTNIKFEKGDYIIRPQNIYFTEPGKSACKAKVIKAVFCGYCYLVEVVVADIKLVISSLTALKKEEYFGLMIDEYGIWKI